MIKLQNYTPEIYYKESRDFQFIGRLFDLVLNAVKTDADLLYYIPLSTDSDERLLELLTLTLGFTPKHQYNAQQLKAICSVLSEILRNKGSIKALKIACESLFNAMDISQSLDYDFTLGTNNTELNLYIPPEYEDIIILNDLLNYVLPAGMSCNIIKELQIKIDSNTNIGITDIVKWDTGLMVDPQTGNYVSKYNSKAYAQLPKILSDSAAETTDFATGVLKTGDAIKALINSQKDNKLVLKPGFSVNSEIIKLEDNQNG